jgi:hypothetical protein
LQSRQEDCRGGESGTHLGCFARGSVGVFDVRVVWKNLCLKSRRSRCQTRYVN